MIFYILTAIAIILLLAMIFVCTYNIVEAKKQKKIPSKKTVKKEKTPKNQEKVIKEEEKPFVLTKELLKKQRKSSVITIGKDITEIEDNCFIQCTNLVSIKVDEENKHFCSKLGVLFTKDMKKIIYYPPLKQTSTYFIPQGVEEICDHAFFNNKNLKYIIIPTSLSIMGENSFVNCKFINQLVIPDSVKEIHPKSINMCPRITVRCYKYSLAEDFCIKYFVPFEYLLS